MLPGAASTLRKVLQDGLEGLLPELESYCEAQADARADAALAALAEHLNQALRRLREAGRFPAAAAVLADTSAAFCGGCAVFRVNGENELIGERIRGVDEERAGCFLTLKFPARDGSAFAATVETRDPQVALAGPGEISPKLAELLAHAPGERVALFPIAVGSRTAGVLYAWGEPQMGALELLAVAAGMALEAGTPAAAESGGLVAIAPAPAKPAPDWNAMPAAEREAHFRARRFARVQVAEIRLHRPEDVAGGRARRDLYGALREAIDEGRETFRRRFLVSNPGMADYFHEELLRTLANADPDLLGKDYPGPLA